jgi:hypothetical protein
MPAKPNLKIQARTVQSLPLPALRPRQCGTSKPRKLEKVGLKKQTTAHGARSNFTTSGTKFLAGYSQFAYAPGFSGDQVQEDILQRAGGSTLLAQLLPRPDCQQFAAVDDFEFRTIHRFPGYAQ